MKLSIIQPGLCECGCGQTAPVAKFSHKRRGWVKGQPLRFVHGHNRVPNRYQFSRQDSSAGGSRKKGYKYAAEHKERIRHAKSARGFKKKGVSGAAHGNWGGGGDIYWRRQALKRDDYTCQKCGLREPEIVVVDHIMPKSLHPELRFCLDNMQTLCPNCHARKTIPEKTAIAAAKKQKAVS